MLRLTPKKNPLKDECKRALLRHMQSRSAIRSACQEHAFGHRDVHIEERVPSNWAHFFSKSADVPSKCVPSRRVQSRSTPERGTHLTETLCAPLEGCCTCPRSTAHTPPQGHA